MELKRLALFNIADFTERSRFSSLGLGYLASYLRKYSDFKDTHILEGNVRAKLQDLRPQLIGIYSVTQTFKETCSVARSIKEEYPNVALIIGGYHISALPNTLPDVFDAAVLGEGEETTKELLEAIAQYGINPGKLANVKGIAFHDGAQVKLTAPRPRIEDLDSIPFPARDLLYNSAFSSIITSRGCPYKCIFCASVRFWGNPRFHSPDYVVSEIEEIISKYKAVHISIWDDLFVANRPRFEKICDLINKRKINRKVSFGCALRSNLVTDELCLLMRKMNIKRASIGFESGSQRVLNMLKCGSVTVEEHIKAVELCKSHGIFITGTFMIGNPQEDEAELSATHDLIKKLKLSGGGSISLAAPLPGTLLWEYAKNKNLVREDMDFSRIGIMSTDFSDPAGFKGVILSDKISKERFFQIAQEMQKESNRHYLKGLLRIDNLSLRNIKFIISRPKEVLAILKFAIKSLLGKSSLMERYVFYYKKTQN